MQDLAGILGAEAAGLEPEVMPEWVAPMLATLTHDLRERPGWSYERKFDGERCLAYRRGGKLTLYSRNAHVLDATYPEVFQAFAGDGADFILDGEVTARQGAVSDFQLLQKRMQIGDPEKARESGIEITYNLFDILHYDGKSLRNVPQAGRKRALEALVPGLLTEAKAPVEVAETIVHWSEAFQRQICDAGWEGLIAKDPQGPYVSRRAEYWLKYKCLMSQALVIGGYTNPKGSRVGFGALLVGVYDDAGQLHYAGKVGTGFDTALLESLSARLKTIEIDAPAFVDPPRSTRGVHWVAPKLVAEIGFTEWTDAGKLRHPRFLGLRDDKAPEETRREDPK